MKRWIWLLVVVMISATSAEAQQPAVYVATPGESFGPIKLGEYAPLGPRIICSIDMGKEYSNAKHVTISYLESGLQAGLMSSDGNPPYRVESARISDNPFYGIQNDDVQKCITNDGKPAPVPSTIPIPRAIYATNRGVQLGATIEDVLTKHGAPGCIVRLKDTHVDVFSIQYDGLEFRVDKGKVWAIEVVEHGNVKISISHNLCAH